MILKKSVIHEITNTMLKSRKLIIPALIIAILAGAFMVFMYLYDFNVFKPMISHVVKQATGRDLVINGDIHFIPTWPPAFAADNVSFQNAPWGSTPYMAKTKKLTASISILPMLSGDFRLSGIHFVEPEVMLEFNSEGRFNWIFETSDSSVVEDIPIMAFNGIKMEKGWCRLVDQQTGLDLKLDVDHLAADIDGLDHPIRIHANGIVKDRPFEIQGSFGPIMAWIKPDRPLILDLKTRLGEITAQLKGAVHDPMNFERFSLSFMAKGPSTREVTTLAGLTEIPEFGIFDVKGVLHDQAGRMAVEHLKASIGSRETLQLAASGSAGDLIRLQDIDLSFLLRTESMTNLKFDGMPVLPEYGPIEISGTLSAHEEKQYRIDKISVAAGAHTLDGRVVLNLAGRYPVLDAFFNSQIETYGTFTCTTRMSGPLDRISVDNIELRLEETKGAKAYVAGSLSNLNQLEGVDLRLNAYGKELSDLENVIGRPMPVRGPYTVSANLNMPDRSSLQMPGIKVILGRTRISGHLDLDLSGETAHLNGTFENGRLDLKKIMARHIVSEQVAEGLGEIGPTHLEFSMTGPLDRPALNRIDLRTEIADLAKMDLNGAIGDLRRLNRIDLNISTSGQHLQNLEKFTGRPMPFQGPFAISGKLINTAGKTYRIENFRAAAGMNTVTGSIDIDLKETGSVVTAGLKIPNLTLQALSIGQGPTLDRLKAIEDLGPLSLKTTLIPSKSGTALKSLDIRAGHGDLARVRIQGSADDIMTRKNMALSLQAAGSDIVNLTQVTGWALPVKGEYALSCKISEHAPLNIMLADLAFAIDRNRFNGWANFNLTGNQPVVETELSAAHIDLEPVTHASVDPFRDIPDLGPLDLATKLTWTDESLSVPHLDFKMGRPETVAVRLNGAVQSVKPLENATLDFSFDSNNPTILNNAYGSQYFNKLPIHTTGHFQCPRSGYYKIPDFLAKYGDSDIAGSLSLNMAHDKPALTANVSSQKLDLRPIREAFLEHNPQFGKQHQSSSPKGKIFSNQPFSINVLDRMDANIDFQGQELLVHKFAFNDITVGLHLHNGDLDVVPLNFTIGGGSADGKIILNSENGNTALETDLEVNKFEIGPMMEQLGIEHKLEGTMNTSIDLTGSGNSIAALMASLDGTIHLTLDDGQIQNEELAMLERYLGSNVLDLFNPFKARTPYTKIKCLINTVEIDKGDADYRLVMDTEQSALVVAGNINLKDETLNIAIKPTAKKGFGEEHIGSISFSLSQLSRPFGLGGTFARPQIIIDPGRTALTAGKIAAALALGPYGITFFFTDISVGKKNICEETETKMLPDMPEPQR